MKGRSDRAKVMARLGWTESERHRFEATLQGRQHETAVLGMASDVAAMLADWHQTNCFTVQGAEKRAIHSTGVRPGDPTADVMFAFAFARFHRKLVDRLGKKGMLPAILLHGSQLNASADESEEIHIEPPAYMDDFFLPVVSDTAAGLLPRVAPATQVAIATAKEHGLQLNMTSNQTEAVVDFRGKGRQQVLEELAVEFPVVDGQWTPTVHVADGVLLRLVSTYRHLGTQASHGARRGPELAARRSSARAAYHATRKKILSQRRLSKKARVAVACCCQLPSALRGWYLAFPQRVGRWRYGGHVHGAFQDDCQ